MPVFLVLMTSQIQSSGRPDANDIVNHQHGRIVHEHRGFDEKSDNQENHRVAEEEFAPQLRFSQPHQHLHAHDDGQQRLVVGETNSIHEKGGIKIPVLVRRIDPAQQENQHPQKRGDAQGVFVNNHRLTPHVTVKITQTARDKTGNEANHIFPAAVDVFESVNAFNDHAAAARNHQRQQSGGDGAGKGVAQFHAPRNAAEGICVHSQV